MDTEIIVKPLVDLTPFEFRICSKLTFGIDGYMQEVMRTFKYDKTAITVLIKRGRLIIGWALLVPSKKMNYYNWGVTDYGKRTTRYTVQIFVREAWRGKGYGTLIMEQCQKIDPRPYVYPHNYEAGALYSKFKVSAEQSYRNSFLKKVKQCV